MVRSRLAASALVVVLALVGCTQEPEEGPQVRLLGDEDGVPVLEYPVPLLDVEPSLEVIWEGTGPVLREGDPVLLDFYSESGTDASVIGETYTAEPRAYRLTRADLGEELVEALAGRHVGSRLLQVIPAGPDQPGPVVAVMDLRPTRATGDPVEPRADLPVVSLADDGAPEVEVPTDAPPTDLVIQPLLRGTGPQVGPGQVVTVQYLGVRWSDGTEFESTWGEDGLPAAFPIGVGSVIPGWDAGLVEQTVGSQVLLVVPPELGYGGTVNALADETLVFVVDILAASGGPED